MVNTRRGKLCGSYSANRTAEGNARRVAGLFCPDAGSRAGAEAMVMAALPKQVVLSMPALGFGCCSGQ